MKLTKEHYEWSHDAFHVPDEVYKDFQAKTETKGAKAEENWSSLFESYKENILKQVLNLNVQ